MQNVAERTRENTTLDVFKMLACIMITATHLPSFFTSETVDFYYNGWVFRFCVPFFFVTSGYFFFSAKNKGKRIKRVLILYAMSYLLYLPQILKESWDLASAFSAVRWNLVIGYEHLWYLNALLLGMVIWYVLEQIPVVSRLFHKAGIVAAVLLLAAGALLDEYYRVIDNSAIVYLGELLARFGGPRNVIFMGFPLLVLGGGLAQYEERIQKIPSVWLIFLMVLFYGLAFLECKFLYEQLGRTISTDITFFNWLPALFLFALSFRLELKVPDTVAKGLRKMAEYVYVLHPLVALYISSFVSLTPLLLWIVTILFCCVLYILLEKQFAFKK